MKNRLTLDVLHINYSPYNGAKSLNFYVWLLGIGGLFPRYFFKFSYRKFYTQPCAEIELEILFFRIYKREISYNPDNNSYSIETEGLFI